MNWKYGTGIIGLTTGVGLAAWALSRKHDSYDLKNKLVLITGGSRGLGLQLAREFGASEARVVICARDSQELERARQDLESRGFQLQTVTCDVSDRSQVAKMITELQSVQGHIDVLVNNAGVIQVGPAEEMTNADFENAMSVIFWGTVNTTLALLPVMRERGQGRIVNVTSIGGKVSIPHLLPYSCAKFAATAFSEGLQAEMMQYGVKIVTIAPGLMRTGSHLQAQFKGQPEREYAWFSLGAATPFVSISVERAAKAIVRATKRGDAGKILSVPADLLARFHGAFPALTTEILGLVNQYLLPGAGGHTPPMNGQEAARGLASTLLEIATYLGRKAAQKNNEVAAAV